ncbi:ATP-dependent RNA helicase DeaD [Labrenzia sp. EL_208]|uniref:ATP-dependent RNA helicase DbpA n=1 Tax=Roseibium album TaxID=311410 RepID=A0A0M6ZSQ5_9HYPH|nr:DEAD/DEAH box helicase [Roseibium album]MBG6173768.1 ATP-dependent RNA helicase DeaD [Labrenzia sp. EL_132]MBG6228776.1 ATP-dependent RNA helicase DeaD [Labrenzia sp. EL_208]CTQ60722.1 ATP-dependent RNA helicase DbpA [Roseibium album]CTQ65246.1 ATP-dependent RNA helicase DbpA [Roseibium album]CTQ73316.1 ATP-dependent RNA helicase DbpA [Roseibium album]
MTELNSLAPALSAALAKRGYESLTPVQESVLSDAPAEADLLVSAQTGSGKTVAFGLALAPTLLRDNEHLGKAGAPIALAIAPTRELALQVKEELTWLYEEARAVTASCVGGMDPRTERRQLDRGVHIVVGTPGRLRDHIERGALDLSELRAVVLDEADEMLDMGFREDLEFILDAAPQERRTLMFSATVPKPIAELAKRFQKDAVRLSTINAREQHGDIHYVAHPVAPNERENAIINVLRMHEAEKAIVFCSTREAVSRLTSRLANRGFSIVSLSGELSQEQRSSALAAMKDGRARVCVATDVAARGIDLPNLDLVVHADLPTGKAGLLHRSGRTGRAGRKGTCVLMVPFPRRRQAERVLQFAGIKATWTGAPTAEAIRANDKERLLADPALSVELEDEDRALAMELLALHSAEQLAAAFVKLRQSRMPAPEEIAEIDESSLRGRDAGSRGGRTAEITGKFEDGIWFSLSLGHRQRAEPRWILPMICRAGHVTKKEVGAIKIFQNELYFEIAGSHGKRFSDVIKREGSGEENVTITLLDARGGKIPAPPKDDGFRRDRGGPPKRRPRKADAPDYETLGPEDSLKSGKPKRGPKRDFDAPRGKKRRRDDDAAPNHPAYEPLDMKALSKDQDSGDSKPHRKGAKEGDADARRKPKPRIAAKTSAAKKKAPKKNKPSRAERKASKAQK